MDEPSETYVYQDRWEVVLEGMRKMILSGEMAPGSKIREADLAERFRVSRGPIRESLRALEVMGLVVREPRRPSYVAPVRATDVEEIYSLREAVEVLAIRKALTHNPEGLVRELEQRLQHFEEVVADPSEDTSSIVEADIHFHEAFYSASGHHRLQTVWQTFNDPLHIMMRLSSLRTDPAWRDAQGGHLAIAKAAVAGDIEGCVEATREHLDTAKRIVLSFVTEGE